MDFSDIRFAAEEGKKILAQIKNKYPALRITDLKISNRLGQIPIDANIVTAFQKFPDLFQDDDCGLKKDLARYATRILKLEKSISSTPHKDRIHVKRSIELLTMDITIIGPSLELNEANIEIIFDELDYELIWKLQCDSLIDRDRTPQTKASIQIVIGSLEDLKRRNIGAAQ